jgi:hypothetical protein
MEEEIKYLEDRIRFLESIADKQSTMKNVLVYQYEAQLCRNILVEMENCKSLKA